MTGSTIAYFGYGSLVNLGSLQTPYISAHRATLKGWKRSWLSRPRVDGSFAADDGLAFLSVVADSNARIDGLLIVDHASSLAALDKREIMYTRTPIAAEDLYFHDKPPTSGSQFLYVADEPAATQQTYILRSYLDVVMQGYLQQFGQDGLQRFFDSTLHFDTPIREDRESPLYPRATNLSNDEKKLFEQFSNVL